VVFSGVRVFGLLRGWRLLRLISTVLTIKDRELESTKDEWQLDQQVLQRGILMRAAAAAAAAAAALCCCCSLLLLLLLLREVLNPLVMCARDAASRGDEIGSCTAGGRDSSRVGLEEAR